MLLGIAVERAEAFLGLGDLPLPDPAGNAALSLTPPSGVSLSANPTSFTFDGLGRPNAAVTLTIVGDITRTLTIEADSGYVH